MFGFIIRTFVPIVKREKYSRIPTIFFRKSAVFRHFRK
nr:MAG TPA: hypothetical protein [Caudoviricetes sp.]